MRNQKKAQVLIVDAEPVMRCGLLHLLNSHPELEVCAEAATLPLARSAFARWRPEVVLVELALAGGAGFSLVQELRGECPALAVVAFTRLEDTGSVQRALRAGVSGYVTRLDPVEALVEAVLAARGGRRFLAPRVAEALLETLAQGRVEMARDDLATLSERERQVFRLIGEGRRTCAIAVELGLSVKTVETHRQHIKEKLGLRDGLALQRRAALWAAGDGKMTNAA
jgi:DNA-binding NarL/FixJ family response regulator